MSTRDGDNLIIYKAIELAPAGSVLVVAAGGSVERAVMGEIVVHHAYASGIAAIVVDGAVRDASEIARASMPVYSRGTTPAGPYKSGPGAIHSTVAIGRTVVADGDAVVCDADGAVAVPHHRVHEVIEGGAKQLAREDDMLAAAARGALDTTWVDAALSVHHVQ